MPSTKNSKLRVTVCQVNGEEQVHTLWHVKFCPLAGANLFSLMCKLLQGNKISSNKTNNIVVNTPSGNIVLDHWIKTHDGWVTGVNFIWNSIDERELSAIALIKQNINNLHVELRHPSEAIMRSTTKYLGIQVTSMFNPCEDCTLGKAKEWVVSKKAVPCPQILGERLFFDISSPSTLTFGGKHHWLLVIDNCSDYCWSFFPREKSDLTHTMLVLIDNLKTRWNLQVQHSLWMNLWSGRAGDQLQVYSPRYTPTKWTCQMQVCYPFQLGMCHA